MKSEANLLKTLGEPTRLRLAALLAVKGETCVCYLAEALGEADFKVSRHLGILRAAGVVEARREGTWMHYRLAKPAGAFAKSLQRCLKVCLGRHPKVMQDVKRLSKACGPATEAGDGSSN
ncbi:MAG: metalloregulator ArsR/SmtB family transcription factor [Planctomycetes bacterium]|nr:metalloregulator ArsR/SmtB family transcription factor [Planctomycetota bacterium]